MANYDTSHAVHLAKTAHHWREKHEKHISKIKGIAERFLGTVEVGAGAWLGGVVDGRSAGKTFLHVPLSLGLGAACIAIAHTGFAGADNAGHLNNVGNGFVANYLSSVGHAFGERWRSGGIRGALHGGAASMPLPPPAAMPDATTMAAMANSMKAAAGVY